MLEIINLKLGGAIAGMSSDLNKLTGEFSSFDVEEAFRKGLEDWARAPRTLALSEVEARRLRPAFKDTYSWPTITKTLSSADWTYKPTEDMLPDIWDDNERTPVVRPDTLGDSYLLVILTDISFQSAISAGGIVRVKEQSWYYQFTRTRFDTWVCDELGGFLGRLPDGRWVVVCRIID
jgi:hypothetical protein